MDATHTRRLPLALGIAAAVLVLDQVTKLWAEHALLDRGPISVLGEFLQLRLLYNPGAAFSIGAGSTWIFTIVTLLAVVWLLRHVLRPQPNARAVVFALLLGGAATHLMDRLFRPPGFGQGHVVDFIDYNGWFVGNVADVALVCGVVWLVLLTLRGPVEEKAE